MPPLMRSSKTLVQIMNSAFEGAVVAGINIGACKGDDLVRFDSGAFESHAAGSLIVKLTDIQHATIGQRVPVSNRKHAAARAAAKYLRATFRLQRRCEDLRGARSVFTGQHD